MTNEIFEPERKLAGEIRGEITGEITETCIEFWIDLFELWGNDPAPCGYLIYDEQGIHVDECDEND